MPTVLIADDDPVMRMLLTAIVSADAELTLVGAAADTDEAIALAARHTPDVVLLDVEMPGGGGLRAARAAMHDAGADGYIVKGAAPDEVARALRGT